VESNQAKNYNYHIMIHFKKPIDGSPGSIEFNKSFDYLKSDILDLYNNCCTFYCEDRRIHPLNVSRMSICKTEKRSGDLLPKELKESGVNSKQFDYLLKNNTPQNEGNILYTRKQLFKVKTYS
jgi:hypothetical protein